jgi:hypothetical protein
VGRGRRRVVLHVTCCSPSGGLRCAGMMNHASERKQRRVRSAPLDARAIAEESSGHVRRDARKRRKDVRRRRVARTPRRMGVGEALVRKSRRPLGAEGAPRTVRPARSRKRSECFRSARPARTSRRT